MKKSEMKATGLNIELLKICLVVMFILMLGSCDRQKNMRGHDFVPDMVYSQAYDTYSDNPNFKDSVTMRIPDHNSVPRGFLPFRYTVEPASRKKAGLELVNPFLPTDEVLERGKYIFGTFCIHCHGISGAGNGFLFTSGLYPLRPRDLTGTVVRRLKDGEIFHTITLGFNSMGAHGSQIKADDRWKLVRYIRKLQQEAPDSLTLVKATKK